MNGTAAREGRRGPRTRRKRADRWEGIAVDAAERRRRETIRP